MEANIESLSSFIVERTNSHWAETKRPYYLSNVSPELKKIGIDYKEIIFPETLKHFAENALSGKVNVVVHPSQKAKVGLIPVGERYDFIIEESSPASLSSLISLYDHRRPFFSAVDALRKTDTWNEVALGSSATEHSPDAVLNFLKALRGLSAEEIDGVKIPTSVLIKLLVRDED